MPEKTINSGLKERAGIFGFSRILIIPWAIIAISTLVIGWQILALPATYTFLLTVWAMLTWVFLIGRQPHIFLSKVMYPTPLQWMRGSIRYKSMSNPGKKKRPKNQRSQDKKNWYSPLEQYFDSDYLIRFDLNDRNVGAVLMAKDTQNSEAFRLVFGWDCQGIHPTLSQDRIETTLESIAAGLADIPGYEQLTFYLSAFADDDRCQQDLTQLAEQAPSDYLRLLIASEKKKITHLTWKGDPKERSPKGIRKVIKLKIFATYTVTPDFTNTTDSWEKLLAGLDKKLTKLSGKRNEVRQKYLADVLFHAYDSGFEVWNELLRTKMNLAATPMSDLDLWTEMWSRFNHDAPIQIPQLIIASSTGLTEEVRSNIHFNSHLLRHPPKRDRQWVHVKNRYCAVIPFLDNPKAIKNNYGLLGYLWDLPARDSVIDTEVVMQVTKQDQGAIRQNMQDVTKESIVKQRRASRRENTRNIRSEKSEDSATAAQSGLLDGKVALHTGVAILVYRRDLRTLREACNYINNCFVRPAWVEREQQYAWDIWLQAALPFLVWTPLLSRRLDRRMVLFNDDAPCLMPIMKHRQIDGQGVEFITKEGGEPLAIDLFDPNKVRHAIVLATTRAGKSVLVSRFLTDGLARSIPVTVLDFPPSETASTFRDWAIQLGGAYFSMATESNNFFEIPDLSLVEDADACLSECKTGIVGILMVMVAGSVTRGGEDLSFRRALNSLLVPMVNDFFSQSHILERYQKAHQAGLRSVEWQQMPTLNDFFKFFQEEAITQIPEQSRRDPTTRRAISQIERQLRAWLQTSVGKALSQPSSFDMDNPLVVFALVNLPEKEPDEAAVLSMAAYGAARRKAMRYKISLLCIDEFSVGSQREEFSELVARMLANEGKAGIRALIASQDPDAISRSQYSSMIAQNLAIRIIGCVEGSAIASFRAVFGYPEYVLRKNTDESFRPNRLGLFSNWTIDTGGRFTPVRFYPSNIQLALLANNTVEVAARQTFFKRYPNHFHAIAAFAQELVQSIQNDRPLQDAWGEEIKLIGEKEAA